MSAAGTTKLGDAWEMEGVYSSTLVEHMHVIVVAGMDATETSRMAIGVGRAVSAARRVTIADLWGDLPEMDAMAGEHDGHGIADVLLFGASLARVRRSVGGSANLGVVTSGNDMVDREDILVSERWESVRAGFRDRNELLLLTCRGDTPGLASLSASADGVLLAGGAVTASLPNVVVTVRRAAATPPFVATQPHKQLGDSPSTSKELRPENARDSGPSANVHRWPMILLLALSGIGTLALAIVFFTGASGQALLARMSGRGTNVAVVQANGVLVQAAPEVLNPQDSASASAFAVEIAVMNTLAGADMRLAEMGTFAGATISPIVSNEGDTWYHVLAGAFATREEAEIFQSNLRALEVQMAEGDHVVRRPIALRLAVYPADSAAASAEGLSRYISLGVPAYVLKQTDGSLVAYAGAFQSTDQAAHFAELCASKGVVPRFVYRTGR